VENLNKELPVEKLLEIKDPVKYFAEITKQFSCLVHKKIDK